MRGFDACFTVDLEPDCPPFLEGFRGIEQGQPKLMALLHSLGVQATFFTTGEVATKYPETVRRLVDAGHELGCHGMTHTAFTEMSRAEAESEIHESAAILRQFAPVTSFRAPYLQLPEEYLDIVEAAGFRVDSSQAKYKRARRLPDGGFSRSAVTRIPASLTSSALRIPRVLREAYVRLVDQPVVLFVHPWEFVDLRREKLRYDCRFRTGDVALECVGDVLEGMLSRGARFITIRQLGDAVVAT